MRGVVIEGRRQIDNCLRKDNLHRFVGVIGRWRRVATLLEDRFPGIDREVQSEGAQARDIDDILLDLSDWVGGP